jgi:hypothetical protein
MKKSNKFIKNLVNNKEINGIVNNISFNDNNIKNKDILSPNLFDNVRIIMN